MDLSTVRSVSMSRAQSSTARDSEVIDSNQGPIARQSVLEATTASPAPVRPHRPARLVGTWSSKLASLIWGSVVAPCTSLLSAVLALVVGVPQLGRLQFDTPMSDETGEGVISTAIVVLIIAFLAVGMWVAFKTIMATTTTGISNQVAQLGQ
ncbi:MAG: hypothetical protein ACP5O0_00365 [Acidimicrobiales bacterium]